MSTQQEKWISSVVIVIWVIGAIIPCYILRKEIQNRTANNKKPLFASKALRVLSILPLIFATIYPFSGILYHIDYLCLYAFQFGVMIFCALVVSFGFYQLARLYYCFSQAQSYSNTGYSNKLFIK